VPNLAEVRAADGVFVGEVGLCPVSALDRQTEIGYLFDPAHHGQGHGTEAAALMVRLGLEEIGAHRVAARPDARRALRGPRSAPSDAP
jgi:RimJ/RimL family protein N-acetyltransferase